MTETTGWGILVDGDRLLCQVYHTETMAFIATQHMPKAKPVRVVISVLDDIRISSPPPKGLRLVVSNKAKGFEDAE